MTKAALLMVAILIVLAMTGVALAASQYDVSRWTLSSAGGEMASESYHLRSVIGEATAETSQSDSFVLQSGFLPTVVDTTPPQVIITSPVDGQTYLNTQGTIPVQYTATDACDNDLDIVVKLDGNIFTGDKINLCGMPSGEHTLIVSATDNSGNTGTASATFKVVPKAMQSFVIKNLAIQWAPHRPKSQGNDWFSIFGRLQLPQGYTVGQLQNQATVTITIASKSGNDTVVLNGQLVGRPQSQLWLYKGSEQPPGEGMNINKMVIWWAPQGTKWAGSAGFYIGGKLQLPGDIGIDTKPTDVKVTVEIPVTTAAGCGSLMGEQTVKCSVMKPVNLWFYNAWPNLATFPYDPTGKE